MKTLTKVLVYSNPIGWSIGLGILGAVIIKRIGKDIKKTNEILLEED
jgi:hypothetical protein